VRVHAPDDDLSPCYDASGWGWFIVPCHRRRHCLICCCCLLVAWPIPDLPDPTCTCSRWPHLPLIGHARAGLSCPRPLSFALVCARSRLSSFSIIPVRALCVCVLGFGCCHVVSRHKLKDYLTIFIISYVCVRQYLRSQWSVVSAARLHRPRLCARRACLHDPCRTHCRSHALARCCSHPFGPVCSRLSYASPRPAVRVCSFAPASLLFVTPYL
jgi:hypothetical protein